MATSAWDAHCIAAFQDVSALPASNYNWLVGSIFLLLINILTARVDGTYASFIFAFFVTGNVPDVAPGMASTIQRLITDGNRVENTVMIQSRRWGYHACQLAPYDFFQDVHVLFSVEYTKVLGTPVLGLFMLAVIFFACDGTQNMPVVAGQRTSAFDKCLYIYTQFISDVQYGMVRCSILILKSMLPYGGLQCVLVVMLVIITQIKCHFKFEKGSPTIFADPNALDHVYTIYGVHEGSTVHTKVSLDSTQQTYFTDIVLLVAKAAADLILTHATWNNNGFLVKYIVVARSAMLVCIASPKFAVFAGFFAWSPCKMAVVGMTEAGFTFSGLVKIIMNQLSWVFWVIFEGIVWVVDSAFNILSVTGWTVEMIRELSSGDFSKLTAGPFKDTMMSIDEWVRGFTILFALFVIFLVVQHHGVFNRTFSAYLRTSTFPLPFFLTPTHILYMQVACASVSWFTWYEMTGLVEGGNRIPLVPVQICFSDTHILILWLVVEVIWGALYMIEYYILDHQSRNRLMRFSVTYTTLQAACGVCGTTIIVAKTIKKRCFLFDFTEDFVADKIIKTHLSKQMSDIILCVFPAVTVDVRFAGHRIAHIDEEGGLVHRTNAEQASNDVEEAAIRRIRENRSRNAQITTRPAGVHHAPMPVAPAVVAEQHRRNPLTGAVVVLAATTSACMALLLYLAAMYLQTEASYASSAWTWTHSCLPAPLQGWVFAEIPWYVEAFFT